MRIIEIGIENTFRDAFKNAINKLIDGQIKTTLVMQELEVTVTQADDSFKYLSQMLGETSNDNKQQIIYLKQRIKHSKNPMEIRQLQKEIGELTRQVHN